jgi:hypothetical protein
MNIEPSADKAKLLLDDSMLDGIIKAAGEVPANLDRDGLRYDLRDLYRRYSLASGPGQTGFNKRQSERLDAIEKHARKLLELLKADAADLDIIRSIWPVDPDRPAHLLPQITARPINVRLGGGRARAQTTPAPQKGGAA